jgi:DNA-binding beta-propeller fold protein YncE
VESTIEVGKYPDDVAASADGRVIYVNRVESMGHPLSKRAGRSGEVLAISTETEEVLWRVAIEGWPHHMTVSADDRWLFVPMFDRMYLAVVDIARRQVVGQLPAPLGSHGTRLSPDGKRLYVGSMLMDMIVVYDVASRLPVRRIPFDDAVRPFTMTADEKRLFVQLSRLNGFQEVDPQSGKVVRRVDLPTLPPGTELPEFYPHTYNHGMEISPDGKFLLAAGSAAHQVCVYRLPELELVKVIPVGKEPNWIDFDRAGRFAYVSNRVSDTLSVIRMDELVEVKQIQVGQYPQRMRVVNVPSRAQ